MQIGDIHLTSSLSASPFVDAKDPLFPAKVSAIIATSPLKRVFKRIFDYLESGAVDGILFMGDLTDYGNIKGYEACCQYIVAALQIGPKGLFPDIAVGLVPGNHDVDRKLASEPSLNARFATLSTALATTGLGGLPTTLPTKLTVGTHGPKVGVLLVNSCWGCGDIAQIPDHFRKPIADAIDAVIAGGTGDDAIKTYYDRQLDTPAISEDTINSAVQQIRAMPVEQLAVVVAHHNLLPQRMTRLAPYTELVNGGAIRSSLSEIGRPILYLHGHIHEDPIEVVQSPGGPAVVVVSAPLVTRGFNVIDVIYSPNSVAIACHVTPIRFDKSGILVEQPVQTISLGDRHRRRVDPLLTSLFSKLLEKGRAYWSDVEQIGQRLQGKPSGAILAELVEQLYADGLIMIDNFDQQNSSWIVRAEM